MRTRIGTAGPICQRIGSRDGRLEPDCHLQRIGDVHLTQADGILLLPIPTDRAYSPLPAMSEEIDQLPIQ
jgi:hypothetical protein